jgi:hypothetical protein
MQQIMTGVGPFGLVAGWLVLPLSDEPGLG